jgi:hypothetical protein
MYPVAISSTGLFIPPHVITNEELVLAFNAYRRAGKHRPRGRDRRRHARRDPDVQRRIHRKSLRASSAAT